MSTKSQSKKVSFILYEDELTPRFFSVNKNYARFLLFGLPTLTLIVLLALTAGAVYFKQIQTMAQRKEPEIIKKLKAEKDDLILASKQLERERDVFKNKLAMGVESPSGLGFLSLYKQSPGRQDLSASPEMALEEVQVASTANTIDLSFKIMNMTKDESRLTGYLFIVMQLGQHIEVWPSNSFDDQTMQLSFAKGEYFATSRFRPVKARFQKQQNGQVLFKVIVFGRNGDLIFKQLISRPI